MYSITKCRKSGSKAAYNYKNEDFLLHKVNKMEIERVTNPLFSPRKSIVLEDKVFSNLVWWDQMTEIQNERNIHLITMLIIIHMERKQKITFVRLFYLTYLLSAL